MSVEFSLAAPLLVVLMLLVAFGGFWFNSTSQVGAAARDAARTASDIVDWGGAQGAATVAAQQDLSGACPGGLLVQVIYLPAGSFAAATEVEATVHCTMSLSPFNYIGVTGNHQFSAIAYAPLDPYSYRTGS
jgi:hypothetical protein